MQLGFGGAVSPPTGPGQSPGGGRGMKPPEARDFTVQMAKIILNRSTFQVSN